MRRPTSRRCARPARSEAEVPTPRSYLFVPGNRPERFDKALAAGADAVIVDLEDAVGPTDKPAARAALARWLDAARPVWIRVNGVDTPWFADDLAAARRPGVAGVVVPKSESAAQVADVARALPGTSIIPLIETAAGVWHALAIASAPQVARLAFGSVDLALDLEAEDGSGTFGYARARVVFASRVARIAAPVDGVTLALADPAMLDADVVRARREGFGAKFAVHPRQVPAINQGFAPTPAEIEWARRVMAAAGDGNAAAQLDGRMIDRPVIEWARRLLKDSGL